MLTWVTILYLPLSFIAGVFSMGHGIVPEKAGWGTFGWLMVVFVFVTMIFALSLQLIIGRSRRVWKEIGQIILRETTSPATRVPPAVVPKKSKLKDVFEMRSFGLRRRSNKEAKLEDLETGVDAE